MPAWGDRMCTPESRTKSVLAETVGSAVFSDSLDRCVRLSLHSLNLLTPCSSSYKTWPSSSCPPHPPYPPTPIFANPPSHTNTIIMQFKLHSILSLFLASNSLVAAAPYYYDGNHDDGSAAAAAAAAGGSAAAAAASCNRYRGYSRFEYYRVCSASHSQSVYNLVTCCPHSQTITTTTLETPLPLRLTTKMTKTSTTEWMTTPSSTVMTPMAATPCTAATLLHQLSHRATRNMVIATTVTTTMARDTTTTVTITTAATTAGTTAMGRPLASAFHQLGLQPALRRREIQEE